jgi:hypothetical protein
MRLLISLLLVLSLSLIELPGRLSEAAAASAASAPRAAVHSVQARKKKRAAKPRKAKTVVKKADKPKKNDPGFAL